MALESGGTAWNLSDLRAGGDTAQAFTDAFSRFSASALSSRTFEIPLSDVVVAGTTLNESTMSVVLRNRGVADIAEAIGPSDHRPPTRSARAHDLARQYSLFVWQYLNPRVELVEGEEEIG